MAINGFENGLPPLMVAYQKARANRTFGPITLSSRMEDYWRRLKGSYDKAIPAGTVQVLSDAERIKRAEEAREQYFKIEFNKPLEVRARSRACCGENMVRGFQAASSRSLSCRRRQRSMDFTATVSTKRRRNISPGRRRHTASFTLKNWFAATTRSPLRRISARTTSMSRSICNRAFDQSERRRVRRSARHHQSDRIGASAWLAHLHQGTSVATCAAVCVGPRTMAELLCGCGGASRRTGDAARNAVLRSDRPCTCGRHHLRDIVMGGGGARHSDAPVR